MPPHSSASEVPAADPPDPVASDPHGFVHLHLHSEYSLLDGGNRMDKLVGRVKELGMGAVAVTDHGNLFGAMSLDRAARGAGIKPIFGTEAYVASASRHDRKTTGVADGGFHLVLLCETQQGWRNLVRLASCAYLEGFYYKPRIDRELLGECGSGLIAINGHLGSELAHHLVEYEKTQDPSHYDRAVQVAQWHKEAFGVNDRGEPCFYIELQHHIPEQNAINAHLIRLAHELSLPLVCDNDSHFLGPDDHDAHDTLVCISTGKLKDDPSRMRYTPELYVKSPEQMRSLFEGTYGADGKEACDNTLRIASRCDVEMEVGNHAPVVKVVRPASPMLYKGEPDLTAWFKGYCDAYRVEPYDASEGLGEESLKTECDAALRELCHAGLVWRYGPSFAHGAVDPADSAAVDRKRDILARLDRELGILSAKSISAYFLIVWDFVNWGRQRGIPANARGSGVGTMVGYLIGLSNACPVRYGLLFERFTDPDRAEYPDIDIDLCQDGRAEVIDYVRQKYGHVAQIITFGTMKARAAVRDVGRVLNMPLPEVDRLAKLIPEELGITLDKALSQEPDLRSLYDSDALCKRVVDTGRRLEGQARHASVHAAGVIVATRPLQELVPLYKQSGSEDVITQWDGPTCEKIGLLKMDFLGLRTLSVIERCVELVREGMAESDIKRAVGWEPDRAGDPLDLERLVYDDPRVFSLFQRADTTGVFQFESGGMRRLLVEMKPDRLEDLIAANALFRPGPMDLIPDYNRRKHGLEPVPSVHEIVDRFTAETYGVMVYQEQVMQIVHELGGIPLRAAYTLIKAISKKKKEVIDANRATFIAGAGSRGFAKRDAENLFDLILKFAGYGFNKSHSTGYAIVAYQTAFLKSRFPAQYMAAFLSFESQAQKVSAWTPYLDDCRKTLRPSGAVGVDVRPPDVNLSGADFSVVFDESEPHSPDHGHIRFGLKAIKGAGAKAVASIVHERRQSGFYTSLHDLCERVPSGVVNKSTIESLIKCGALDALHGKDRRSAMAATVAGAVAAGQSLAKDKAAGQASLFGSPSEAPGPVAAAPEPPLARADPWPEPDALAFEKETLGFYVSSHPLDRWGDRIASFSTADLASLPGHRQDHRLLVGGMVQSVRPIVVRNGPSAGQKMAILMLEDQRSTCEAVCFSDVYAQCGSALVPDSVVLLLGKVDHSRGGAQLIVERVTPIDRVPAEYAGAVEFTVDARGKDARRLRSDIEHLVGLVRSHGRGFGGAANARLAPLRISLLLDGQRVDLEAGAAFRVAATGEFLGLCEQALGPGCVRAIPGGLPSAPRDARPRWGSKGRSRVPAGVDDDDA